jgi:biotin synthase
MNAGAIDSALEKAVSSPRSLTAAQLAELLRTDDAGIWEEVYRSAREVRRRCGRDDVLRRALIECSNVCTKDCGYCGIRRSNRDVGRYRMEIGEISDAIAHARSDGFDAVAFQSGEINSEENTVYYERALELCKGLEVTLSLGEQDDEVYRRWKNAGAMRYLLRIETSNRRLYGSLHPPTCSFERRENCIRGLKKLGYVTGTGVMISLPGQTLADLAADIVYFGDIGADMVGMGPWIPHPAAPAVPDAGYSQLRAFGLSLRMIALTRLYLHDVNIVASTALEVAGGAEGRELGLSAGANVVMPNYTPPVYRTDYDLYPGKGG